jgi:hypothetical protein
MHVVATYSNNILVNGGFGSNFLKQKALQHSVERRLSGHIRGPARVETLHLVGNLHIVDKLRAERERQSRRGRTGEAEWERQSGRGRAGET